MSGENDGNSGMPTKIQKIDKLTEIIYQMRPEVGQHCWQACASQFVQKFIAV